MKLANKPEYVETEMGLLPEDWAIKKLGDLATFKNGINFEAHQKGKTGTLTVDVFNMYSKNIFVNLKNLYRVDKTLDPSYLLTDGNVLFVRSSLKREGVGWASQVKGVKEPTTFCGFIIRAALNTDEIYPEFLTYYLRTNIARAHLISQSGKVTITNINQGMLSTILIPIPNHLDQKKIISLLSTIQTSIEKTENVLSSLKNLKKSLIKHLFTYGAVGLGESYKVKLRETDSGKLPEAWEFESLSSFLKPCPRKVEKPKENYKRLGIRSHGKGTFLNHNFDPKDIALKELFQVKENDLIVNITFAWEGAIAIAKKEDEGALVSHRFPTYLIDENKVMPTFLKYLIIRKEFVEKLILISPGSAGRNRVMKKSEFLKIKMGIPSLKEQKEISGILCAVDREIDAQERKKKALNVIFASILNGLMCAKIRVDTL
jgi:type I restriction enzyme, S subunit